MKRCPTCDKTFDDKMKFCQTDGTLLVDDAPPVDPYKTVVGSQSDIASAIPPIDPFKTMVASPPPKVEEPKAANEVLEVPEEIDSLKTMVVSQEEMKQAIKADEATDVPKLDLPPPAPPVAAVPIIEPKAPTPVDFSPPPAPPPMFDEPVSSAADFGQMSPPKTDLPKPVENQKFDSKSKPTDFSTQSPYGNQENKPIPSPFDGSMIGYQPPTAPPFDAPKPPPFQEPASPFGDAAQSSNQPSFQPSTPFDQPEAFNAPIKQDDWMPPPAPVSEWQNQELGANTPFQPPIAGGGQSQTLALVSLILGGIGIITIIPTLLFTLCAILPVGFGLAAIITGFLGRSRASKKPDEYTGGGLALGGIITGAISLLVPIVIVVITLLLVFGMLSFSALR